MRWLVLALSVWVIVGMGWWKVRTNDEPRAGEPAAAFKLEEVVGGLEVPWSIVFASRERMLVAERPGRIREVVNGILNPKPVLVFEEVSNISEEGLMGMTSDPEYIYVCLAYPKNGDLVDKVVRLKDMVVDKILIDDIPAAKYHAGCRLKFGPDGKLYITTGDATKKERAQDQSSLAGKLLRVNGDGSGLEIYSLGHRNSQGLDWNPVTGELWATEHGPSLFDGPAGGDEVNIIKQGGNYGWPLVSHGKSRDGMVSPILVFTPAVAPAGAAFWNGKFYFGGLVGEGIWEVDPETRSFRKLPEVNVGRVREVMVGPDNALYFSTSNRDGRGKVREGDDKIYRVTKIDQ